jgi:glycerophosphoryl diester phosphodiesterase
MLVQGGPSVLPAVREAIASQNEAVRERAIRIVAWQGDLGALPRLRAIQQSDPKDEALAAWAIEKIKNNSPETVITYATKSAMK